MEYIHRNRVTAHQIESIEGCVLTVGDDETITVSNEWIVHNGPTAGGFYVKPPIGSAVFMSAGEFSEEFEAYVPPKPKKKKAAS